MSQYVGIRSEGALIPLDLLDRIAQEQEPGQQAKDFGLAPTARLTDEIARAWSDAQDYWHIFQRRSAALDPTDTGTTITREKWAQPLLSDLLGYKLTFQAAGAQVGGRTYPISHRAGAGEESPPVHIEGRNVSLDERQPGRRLSPQALVQEYLNVTDEHLWGVVTNGLRLRLLRDTPAPRGPAISSSTWKASSKAITLTSSSSSIGSAIARVFQRPKRTAPPAGWRSTSRKESSRVAEFATSCATASKRR